MSAADPATQVFEAHRARLRRLAYRMLGSMSEADDMVQEAFIRWRRADRSDVREPGAFLSRTVTRLCLDAMASARARRETYFGSWLPEPVVEEEDDALAADEVTLTLMLALERLSPLERAAFLLHDVFGTPLTEVADTLRRDPAAVRQLAARARRNVRDARPRYPVERQEGEAIARAFFTASTTGDMKTLSALLADQVVMRADGGGKVRAFPNPILGHERVLKLLAGLHRKLTEQPAQFIRAAIIDGLPGYVSRERDGVLQTTAFAIEGGRIAAIYITRNPDKLGAVAKMVGAPAPHPAPHPAHVPAPERGS